ncbi:hypothetical protein [Rhodopirellula islandica]|uniref:hypothetical protein n=1 Tax=Rhodopirellula islandica TaxID=595434 RepID=UPI00064B6B87|nr:hypothetical protein [Rhodopirellula islandica]
MDQSRKFWQRQNLSTRPGYRQRSPDEVEDLNPYDPPEADDTGQPVEKSSEQRISMPFRIGLGIFAVLMFACTIDAIVDLAMHFQLLAALQIFMVCELTQLMASLAITGRGGWTLSIYL